MAISERGGKPIEFFLPTGIAGIMGSVMEAAAKITGDEPLLTTFNIYNLARNNEFDTTKAREELDFTTRSYEETIHDMVRWFIEQGMLERKVWITPTEVTEETPAEES
jgi:dihydroflavonol-4-reductase